MNLPSQAAILRIFLGEADRFEHMALYEAIVLKARETGLAGATVIRSPMGYGASSRVHSSKIMQLSNDLPIIVEIVDAEEKLRTFAGVIADMMKGGLVTIEKTEVLHHLAKE